MKYFDIYEDTLKEVSESGQGLWKNDLYIDLERTQKYGHYGQYFALWVELTSYKPGEELDNAFYRLYTDVRRILAEASDKMVFCLNSADIQRAAAEKKPAIFLSAEDVASMGKYAYSAYDMGFRVMCIMGVHETQYGYSTASENKGLKPEGKKLINQYLSEGMVIDVAHMSEAGFYDVCEMVNKPIIASHANSRKVYDHHRNLTDDQIHALIQKKGLMGMISFHTFMTDDPVFKPKHVIRHAEHILELGGQDILAFGGDMDGIDGKFPMGFHGIQDMNYLYNEFLKLNYSETLLNKIFYDNAYQFTLDNM